MRPIDADRLLEEKRVHTYYHLKNGDIAIPIIDIKNAPTIEPKWIPCSERLPKRDGDYLVTFHHKWPDREYKTVEVEEFRSGGFDENLYVKVIAWMPLPEPYKEGASDGSIYQRNG